MYRSDIETDNFDQFKSTSLAKFAWPLTNVPLGNLTWTIKVARSLRSERLDISFLPHKSQLLMTAISEARGYLFETQWQIWCRGSNYFRRVLFLLGRVTPSLRCLSLLGSASPPLGPLRRHLADNLTDSPLSRLPDVSRRRPLKGRHRSYLHSHTLATHNSAADLLVSPARSSADGRPSPNTFPDSSPVKMLRSHFISFAFLPQIVPF